jgi:hypothetical protein
MQRKILADLCPWTTLCCVGSNGSGILDDSLGRLRAGQNIQIVETTSKNRAGIFVAVSDTETSLT